MKRVLFLMLILLSYAFCVIKQTPTDPFRKQVAEYDQTLQQIRGRLKANQLTIEQLDSDEEILFRMLHEIGELRVNIEEKLAEQKELLDDLGPESPDGEDADTAYERSILKHKQAYYVGQLRKLKTLNSRCLNLLNDIEETKIAVRYSHLKKRSTPLYQAQLDANQFEGKAIGFTFRSLNNFISFLGLIAVIGSLMLIGLLWFVIRPYFAKKYQKIFKQDHPSDVSKVKAALFYLAQKALVPILTLTALLIAFSLVGSYDKKELRHLLTVYYLLSGLCLYLALIQVIFTPKHDHLRMIHCYGTTAIAFSRRLLIIGLSLALILFGIYLRGTTYIPPGFLALTRFFLILVFCASLFGFLRKRYWSGFKKRSKLVVNIGRYLAGCILIAIPFFLFFGYTNLALFLLTGFLYSSLAILIAYAIFNVLRSAIVRQVHRRGEIFKKVQLGDGQITLVQYWSVGILAAILIVSVFVALLFIWGYGTQFALLASNKIVHGFVIAGHQVSLGKIVYAIVVFLLLLLLVKGIIRLLDRHVFPYTTIKAGAINALKTFISYLGVLFAILITLRLVGFELTSLLYIAGGLSVGMGFALQPIVMNFVSGLIMLIERPVNVGDIIEINNEFGMVNKISVRSTQVKTFEKASINIPNSQLVNNVLKNWTRDNMIRRFDIPVGVAYSSDVKHVEEVLIKLAQEMPGILSDPSPTVLLDQFGSSSLNFVLRAFVKNLREMITIKSRLHFKIVERFKEEGIVIAFPQCDVHLYQESSERG